MKGKHLLPSSPAFHPVPGSFHSGGRRSDFAMDFDRRRFLQATFAGLAALSSGSLLLAKEAPFQPVEAADLPQFNKGNPDTLFLTWQRDPTTTITVTWVGEEMPDAQVAVQVAKVGDDSDEGRGWKTVTPVRVPYPVAGLFVYRAEATGLEPGSQYRLKIGQGKETLRFQTMPAKATDSFQFVSGGDSGSGSNARATNLLAAKQNPMFALIAGDIAYEITSDKVRPKANLRFLKNYREDMIDSSKRLIPIVPAIGNHEVTKINDERVAPFFIPLYGGLFAERTFATLDFGDYLSLVLLDTGHMASIPGEQTDWLDKQLAERTTRPHLIVAQHVPSYPSFRPFEDTGHHSRKNWVPLFEKHNVDIVLEHHDHAFKRTHPLKDGVIDKGGLIYLGDGSWGALRSLKDVEPRSYMATTAENYHVTLHRLEGNQRFHLALTDAGRVVDVCTTQKRALHRMGRGA
jgi:hypothetical protein